MSRGATGVSAVFRLWRVLLVAAAGGLTGCNTSGVPALETGSLALGAGGSAGPRTVAFDYIEMPDERLGRKLAAQLTQEANARKIAVVPWTQPAQYAVRSYVAAHVEGQKTTITWMWEVFTGSDHQRVARFTGQVPGAPSERAWAAANDAVVARIAQDGMNHLADFLASSEPAPASGVASASGAAEEPLAFLPPSRP